MEKYQGATVVVTLLLLVGAALSETFLKVTWSPGLLALIGMPLTAVLAGKAASAIKAKAEDKKTEELKTGEGGNG